MTLLVRDEEDILEANLDYHLNQGIDFVIATDNDSRDGTPEILERYRREGHLHLLRQSGHFDQGPWVNRMARMAATEFGADWVINNDADEFWWPRAGNLKDVFAAVPAGAGLVVAPRTRFVARSGEAGFFADRMTVREVRSARKAEPAHPKSAHRATPEVDVGRNSHKVRGPGLRPIPGWHPVIIFHFPARGADRWATKLEQLAVAYENTGLTNSSHVRVYERHRAGEKSLTEHYAEEFLVPDEAIEQGVNERRLLIDRRLQRYLAEVYARPEGGGSNQGAGAELGAPQDRGSEPGPCPEAADMLDDAMLGFKQAEDQDRRLERERRRADKAHQRRRRSAKRLRALESSRWSRIGRLARRIRRSVVPSAFQPP